MEWLPGRITAREISGNRLTAGALLAANVLPLVGVLLLDWSAFEVVLLYWFENVVLGVINILKMLACSPDPDQVNLRNLLRNQDELESKIAADQFEKVIGSPLAMHGAKLFFVPFFTVHYGLFCLVHGVFVFVLLGPGGLADGQGALGPDLSEVPWTPGLLFAAAALTVSHLVSYFRNYLGRGEYRRTVLPLLMMQPYGRIVVLHIAILFGAFAVMALGSPVFLLAILIVGKTWMDLALHLSQHRDSAENDPLEGVPTTVGASSDTMTSPGPYNQDSPPER